MAWILDRFEADLAVLERDDGSTLDVPRAWLPRNAKEGDVLRVEPTRGPDSTSVAFTLDPEATRQRRADLAKLRDAIPKAPDGDIAL